MPLPKITVAKESSDHCWAVSALSVEPARSLMFGRDSRSCVGWHFPQSMGESLCPGRKTRVIDAPWKFPLAATEAQWSGLGGFGFAMHINRDPEMFQRALTSKWPAVDLHMPLGSAVQNEHTWNQVKPGGRRLRSG